MSGRINKVKSLSIANFINDSSFGRKPQSKPGLPLFLSSYRSFDGILSNFTADRRDQADTCKAATADDMIFYDWLSFSQ